MRRFFLRVPFISIAALACALHVARAVEEDHPVEDAARHKLQAKTDPSLPTLYLVGDSTMKNGTPDQRGWGEEMAQFFDLHAINVVNQAIGGRSSRTFQSEGRWDGVVAMLKKGDYVIIQFGHNDPGPVNDTFRARGSIKGVGEETQEIDNLLTHKHEVVHSFGWYMRKYVTDVKAAGATPIVFSLVPRNSWKDGKVVRSSGNNYGGWAQQVSQATETAFVDHNEIIAEGLDGLGPEKAAALFADGKLHTTPAGAVFNARMAVSGLKTLAGDPFEKSLSPAGREVEAFQPAKSTEGPVTSPARIDLRSQGAAGDGKTKDTAAFEKALAACSAGGGGEVVVPAGTYLIGSIVLPSHTTLRLEKGATLKGSSDIADYPLGTARWEGVDAPAYRALNSAFKADQIAIVGEGEIVGAEAAGKLRNPRGAALVEPVECRGVRIEGVTLRQFGVWTLHPTFCDDVAVVGVTFDTN